MHTSRVARFALAVVLTVSGVIFEPPQASAQGPDVCTAGRVILLRAKITHTRTGELAVVVDSDPNFRFDVANTKIFFNGQECERYIYPIRFRIQNETTRIVCLGGIRELVPVGTVVTVTAITFQDKPSINETYVRRDE